MALFFVVGLAAMNTEPLRLELKLFVPFCYLWSEDFPAGQATRAGPLGSHVSGFFCLVMEVCPTLPPFALLLFPDPGLSISVPHPQV